MTDVQEFEQWKKKIQDLRSRADRARGAMDGLRKRLLEDYGGGSLEEGEQLSRKLWRKSDQKQEEFGRARVAFGKKWDKRLEGYAA